MLEGGQKSNVVMFPKSKQFPEIGSVTISVRENGETSFASDGLSLQELRAALGFVIHLSYDYERNSSLSS